MNFKIIKLTLNRNLSSYLENACKMIFLKIKALNEFMKK